MTVAGVNREDHVSYVRDVNPILSRLGCNQGTCHGSAQGKNGFKLSLRGYDPLFDVRALTDELASRRVNVAAPDSSLMLLKPAGAVPHVGGQLFSPGDPYYEIIREWIADGARLDLSTPRATSIAVVPTNPVILPIGGKQQMRVVATYADGSTRDVTEEAFIESGNGEVADGGPARPDHLAASRRGADPGPLRGGLRRDHPDRHGRPLGLRLDRPARVRPDRRAGRRQVEAAQDPALRASATTPSSSAGSRST